MSNILFYRLKNYCFDVIVLTIYNKEGTGMEISHIAVYTNNLEKSIAFYEMLGAKEAHRVEIPQPCGGKKVLVHMAFGDVVIELVLPPDADMVKKEEGVIGHFCLSCEDIDKAVEELKANGITDFIDKEPTMVGAMGIYKKFFFRGPCGEIIELIQKY